MLDLSRSLAIACAVGLAAMPHPGVAQVTQASRAATGPSAMPAYVPAPQPAYRPLDYSPRSGVTYREGSAYRPVPTGLGASSMPPYIGPALWSGLYLGLHGGYGWGATRADDPLLGRVDRSGPFGGVHLGYNWQSGALVLGLETDLSAARSKGTSAFASGFDMAAERTWTSSLRGRIGYAHDNVLLYATAGAAFAGQTITVSDGIGTWSDRDTRFGYVVGGGLEWKMLRNLSLRGEVLHYRFGEKDMSLGGAVPVRSDDTVVRAGVTLHFN